MFKNMIKYAQEVYMKEPKYIDVFLSCIKYFIIVMGINNLVWIFVVFFLINGSESANTLTQDGYNNNNHMEVKGNNG